MAGFMMGADGRSIGYVREQSGVINRCGLSGGWGYGTVDRAGDVPACGVVEAGVMQC